MMLLLDSGVNMKLQEWDPSIYDKMRDHTGMEEYDIPLPIYISSF